MAQEVKGYTRVCTMCVWVKLVQHKPYGQLTLLLTLHWVWGNITMDFITDLLLSWLGKEVYDSILVIINCFMKMAHYIPV